VKGIERSIYYFHSEGKENLPKTVDLVAERARELDVKHILVFTAHGEGAFLLADKLKDTDDKQIIAVSFPHNEEFLINKEGKETKILAGTSREEVQKKLKEKSILLFRGTMPFEDIILPGADDLKLKVIKYSLSMFSGGIPLCIQSILMACDAGYIDTGEEVISMSADTAIVASSAKSKWMFHPVKGLEIREIICKPRSFTIRKLFYEQQSGNIRDKESK
jgi:hypothetical protein